IAERAGVTKRTLYGYFRSKDEAIVGADEDALGELAQGLRDRPADERPGDALIAVLVGDDDPDGIMHRWLLRNELVARYPALLPRYLSWIVQIEVALTEALAERLGVDIAHDPAPRALVASTTAALRATLGWWW
ncbi:MAG TPA: TetR family transcriptional regulator, partial [Ilumatobacteraceae bacterium]|nr:TetR family transcriptional regulator [Ilumatobacteraceae bacterium]